MNWREKQLNDELQRLRSSLVLALEQRDKESKRANIAERLVIGLKKSARPSPCCDPMSDKYPDRIFHRGRWATLEQIERKRALERVENMTPEQREKQQERGRKRRDDPEYRRPQAIRQMRYRAKKKREEYGDKGYTLRDDDQESRRGGDWTSSV